MQRLLNSSAIEIVCPRCRGGLQRNTDTGRWCLCCGAQFPCRAAVEVFLDDEQWLDAELMLERERSTLELYERARRSSELNVMYYDAWIAQMFAELPQTCGRALAELMCGGAEICRRLPDRFSSAMALDLNVVMVERAAVELQRLGEKRVNVVCGSASALPLPDESVDVVMIQGGLHHTRPEVSNILQEIQRVLKPGGYYVGSEPANDNALIRAIRHWQYRRSPHQGDDPEEDGFTQGELMSALSARGLKLETYRRFGFLAYPFLGNTDLLPFFAKIRSRFLGNALLNCDNLMERVPGLRRFAWANMFRAIKQPCVG